jgi:pimeloyl-ACP methyl ester carboxylesterase
MATHADDLAAFVRQLGAGPAHVVGWSYGGAIAIVLAVHHPEWVKSLFVFEPGLATFVTDPADAQVAGKDRRDMGAPAAMAAKAGDTGAAVRLLIDVVAGQPGTFDRLAPAIRAPLLDKCANASALPAASPDHLRPVGSDQGASGHRPRGIGAAFLPDCGGDGPSLHSRVATHCNSWRRAPRPGQPRRVIQRSPPELPDDPVIWQAVSGVTPSYRALDDRRAAGNRLMTAVTMYCDMAIGADGGGAGSAPIGPSG